MQYDVMEISFEQVSENVAPSKHFADEAWRKWMRLSPDFWRESLGVTVGKIWQQGGNTDCTAWGVNGLYGTREGTGEDGIVQVVEVRGDPTTWKAPAAESVVWRVEGEPDKAGLMVLEGWVMRGVISHYGLAGIQARELGAWVSLGEQVAEEVWGRKKRSGLRCVVVTANLLDMAAFVLPEVTEVRHGVSENIPLAEFAARRGWRILVERVLDWHVPGRGLVCVTDEILAESAIEEAVGRLEDVVLAEDSLAVALGGWPAQDEVALWRAGALVGEGMPLWFSREGLKSWKEDVWPRMVEGVEPLIKKESEAAWDTYKESVMRLLEGGAEILAWLAERRVVTAVMADVRLKMTDSERARWEGVPDTALVAAIMASVPGVTGVLVPEGLVEKEAWVRVIQARPDVADVGRVFMS